MGYPNLMHFIVETRGTFQFFHSNVFRKYVKSTTEMLGT